MKFLQKTMQTLGVVSRRLQPLHIPLHSAHTTFFWVLSLFPCMLLLLGLLRYTSIGMDVLLGFLEGVLPPSLLPMAQLLVDSSYRHSSGMVVSVSALAALWSASRGMYGLLDGLSTVYDLQAPISYWRKRSISMVYTFFFLLLLILTLVLYVFGNSLLDYLWMTTDPILMVLMSMIDFRFLLLLVLQTALFTLMYARVPGQKKRSLKPSLPGGLLASAGWLLCSKLFSIYVEYFTRYANIYGSLYAFALGLLWLYFCINILFYGGVLNCWLQQRKTAR